MTRPSGTLFGRGLTLLETLVVIGIVAVLASLTLVAVASAREAASRSACRGNLKQIGLALHAYENMYRRFPGLGYKTNPPNGTQDFLSAFVGLLPHLGESAIFEHIDFEKAPSDGNFFANTFGFHATVKGLVVARFLCPSDSPRFDHRANSTYAFSTGPAANGRHDGAFALFRSFSVNEISDGLSQTAAVSEIVRGGGQLNQFLRRHDFWFSESDEESYGQMTPDEMLSICAGYTQERAIYVHRGYSWFNGGYQNTWYNHAAAPNASTDDCSVHTAGPFPPSMGGSFASRSAHSGGVQTLFLDGSSRWMASGIELAVWRSLGTRAGGETIPSF